MMKCACNLLFSSSTTILILIGSMILIILTLRLQALSASSVKCDRCTLHVADDDTDGCGEDAHSSAAEASAVE